MESYEYLLVGGGLASASAADKIRSRDSSGSVCIVGQETYLPYHRPPLSKSYLVDGDWKPEDTYHHDGEWYEKRKVEVRLGTRAEKLDLAKRAVTLGGGEEVSFGKLLLATGAEPVRFDLPGSDLEGIHYLRTILDSDALIQASKSARRVAVVGGGFIGAELACAFARRDLKVSLVYMEDRLLKIALPPEVSEWVEAYYREKGVELLPGETVASFDGAGRLSAVNLESGKSLDADFCAVGIGVRPRMDLVRGTELDGEDGVEVDEQMRTRVDGVFAAGDIANYQDIVFGTRRRVEHWDVARGQGAAAGAAMAGLREPYDQPPYFFTTLFDLDFDFVGDFRAEADWIGIEGGLDDKSAIVRCFKDDCIASAVLLGREEEDTDAVRREIKKANAP